MQTKISLIPLQDDDREQFICDNQDAFNYGAMEEFGLRDNHFEEDGEIISRSTIEESIDHGIIRIRMILTTLTMNSSLRECSVLKNVFHNHTLSTARLLS